MWPAVGWPVSPVADQMSRVEETGSEMRNSSCSYFLRGLDEGAWTRLSTEGSGDLSLEKCTLDVWDTFREKGLESSKQDCKNGKEGVAPRGILATRMTWWPISFHIYFTFF